MSERTRAFARELRRVPSDIFNRHTGRTVFATGIFAGTVATGGEVVADTKTAAAIAIIGVGAWAAGKSERLASDEIRDVTNENRHLKDSLNRLRRNNDSSE